MFSRVNTPLRWFGIKDWFSFLFSAFLIALMVFMGVGVFVLATTPKPTNIPTEIKAISNGKEIGTYILKE